MAAASSAPFFGLGDTQMQPQQGSSSSLQQNSTAAPGAAAVPPPKKKRNQPGNPSKSHTYQALAAYYLQYIHA
jgi:hypothetical protein